MLNKKVLVIEGDPYLLRLIKHILSRAGAQVFTAESGEEGVQQVLSRRPHLVILSEVLPEEDGWEVCGRISRLWDAPPIILLTVLEGRDGSTRELDPCAIDCIARPFSPDELLTRAERALRQTPVSPELEKLATFSDDHLTIDLGQHRVLVGGRPARLSAAEYRLLAFLLQNAGRMCTMQQILENVWGYRDCVEYVHVGVWHLRQKLEEDPEQPRYLLSERDAGYCFQNRAPVQVRWPSDTLVLNGGRIW
jgi:two-component system KDP operon response regulator KdpE